jgi:hypothetical protein
MPLHQQRLSHMRKEIPTRRKPLFSEFNLVFVVSQAAGNVTVTAKLQDAQ